MPTTRRWVPSIRLSVPLRARRGRPTRGGPSSALGLCGRAPGGGRRAEASAPAGAATRPTGLHADELEAVVDVDRGERAVGLDHVRLVLRVAVGVGLDTDDGCARKRILRDGRDLGERVTG